MARTKGARNLDYRERRMELARRLRARLMADGGLQASLRDLARASGSSVARLKHYFGDREGVIAAALESLRVDAAPYLAQAAGSPLGGSARDNLRAFLIGLREAWTRYGVGVLQSRSLAAGLATPSLGPGYVNNVLEPLLSAGETLLQRELDLGRLRASNTRYAALELMSPWFLVLLHQDSLSGHACRPLDLDDFLEKHLDAFWAAHSP